MCRRQVWRYKHADFAKANGSRFSITTSPLYYPVGGFTFMVAAITVAIARPYKDSPYFIDIDVILFALVSTIWLSIPSFGYLAQLDPEYITRHVWYRYAYGLLLLPPIYGAGLLIYRLLPKRVLLKLKTIVQYCRCNRRTMNDSYLEVLPHRLEHAWRSVFAYGTIQWTSFVRVLSQVIHFLTSCYSM